LLGAPSRGRLGLKLDPRREPRLKDRRARVARCAKPAIDAAPACEPVMGEQDDLASVRRVDAGRVCPCLWGERVDEGEREQGAQDRAKRRGECERSNGRAAIGAARGEASRQGAQA